MPDANTAPEGPEAVTPAGEFAHLPLGRIIADSTQPRRYFDAEALAELASSIAALGVLQPITVKPKIGMVGEGDYDYVIVAGERRWRAARDAGLMFIPAIVRPDLTMDRTLVAVLQLVENLQRSDLTLWETAEGCRALVEAVGLEGAAKRLGYSKPWVSTRATLADLPEAIVDLVKRGLLTDIETAHNLHALAETDEDGAEFAEELIQGFVDRSPMTREDIRGYLRSARYRAKADQEREAERLADAAQPPRQLPGLNDDDEQDDGRGPDDTDADAPAARPPAASASAPRVESKYERERRIREEQWAALLPDCRALQRETRKAALSAMAEHVGELNRDAEAGRNRFELTISLPNTGTEAPAKPAGAMYPIELNGSTDDAGVLLEALSPTHVITVQFAMTVAQLREIEAVLGARYRVHVPHGLSVRGTVLRDLPTRIRDAQAAKLARDEQRQADQAAIDAARAAAESEREPEAPMVAADVNAQVARFITAFYVPTPNVHQPMKFIHNNYVNWCEDQGIKPIAATDNRWPVACKAAGLDIHRTKFGRVARNIGLPPVPGEGAACA